MTATDAALIERLIPAVTAGIHAADPATLAHEAERYEAFAPSPLVLRMRAIVAAEQAERTNAAPVSSGVVATNA